MADDVWPVASVHYKQWTCVASSGRSDSKKIVSLTYCMFILYTILYINIILSTWNVLALNNFIYCFFSVIYSAY